MKEEIIRMNEKTFVHLYQNHQFKSNVIACFLLTDLNREDVTKNALIPAVLRRGTEHLTTMKDISIKMNDMYGAVFDASIDKIGDQQSIQLYISTIDNQYALEGEDILSEALMFMYEVLYHPKLSDGVFDEKYVEGEKDTLRELIKAKINNKASYAVSRCLEEMLGEEPYALYKYGYEEDLEKITAENLYEHYQKLLSEGELHFYISGNFEKEKIESFFLERFARGELPHEEKIRTQKAKIEATEVKEVVEKMDVVQGKLVLGYNVSLPIGKESFYKMLVYNAILGSSSNSKLFQNVREKASLAYTIRSSYLKHKGILLISAGIEADKYEKAVELTLKQVEDMKQGNFTEEDVKDAKVFLENLFTSCLDDQTTMIELSMGQFVLGVNDTIEEMVANIEQVSKEDVVEVANQLNLVTKYYLTK